MYACYMYACKYACLVLKSSLPDDCVAGWCIHVSVRHWHQGVLGTASSSLLRCATRHAHTRIHTRTRTLIDDVLSLILGILIHVLPVELGVVCGSWAFESSMMSPRDPTVVRLHTVTCTRMSEKMCLALRLPNIPKQYVTVA
jgi:hypothetical protein